MLILQRQKTCWKLIATHKSTQNDSICYTVGLQCKVIQGKEIKNPVQTPDIRLETPSGNRTIQRLHLYTIYSIWFKIKITRKIHLFLLQFLPHPQPPPMKSLLIKGIILSPLSCFGLILRSRLGMVNMKRNGNIWDLYHVHIYPRILSTCSHISRSEKLRFNGSQNAGWMLGRLHGV